MADEGPPAGCQAELLVARLFNHESLATRSLQKILKHFAEVLPPPNQLRCAKLIARRQDDL
jgi:hypothetical protein